MTFQSVAQDFPTGNASVLPERRGHCPKIQEAVAALEACGEFPRNLRPVRRDSLVLGWLTRNGYAADLPSRAALARYFASSACNAVNSGETVSADERGRTYEGHRSIWPRSSNDAQQPDTRSQCALPREASSKNPARAQRGLGAGCRPQPHLSQRMGAAGASTRSGGRGRGPLWQWLRTHRSKVDGIRWP
jgi:hypothetical protein